MPEPLLKVSHLDAFYGDVQVLWDLSLEVFAGEIVAVIGPNGAGKSTLMKAIMGLVAPKTKATGPTVSYRNQTLDRLSPEAVVRTGITLVPEGARVFPEMTCLDNLKLGAYIIKDKSRQAARLEEVLTLLPRLRERAGQRAKTLSGGERQMLAIGRALMGEPKFLLLDEPSLGLHPLMVSRIFKTIETINQQGLSVLLVEQKVTFALKMSHRGYVIENGRIVMCDQGRELMCSDHVKKAYLAV